CELSYGVSLACLVNCETSEKCYAAKRKDIIRIYIHGGCLADEVYGYNQSVGFGFSEQCPSDAFEWAADHLDGHAFVQIRVRVVGQGAFHQHADGVNLIVRDRLGSFSVAHDL